MMRWNPFVILQPANTRPTSKASSPPAIAVADNPSWSGRFGRGARRRAPSISTCAAPRGSSRAAHTSDREGGAPKPAGEAIQPRFRLDAFRGRRVGWGDGRGGPIPESKSDKYDFQRLERVVAELAAAYRHQRAENAGLRREIEQRSQRIRAFEGKLLEANQKRQDVAKRIDELIAQIDQLDASFDSVDV